MHLIRPGLPWETPGKPIEQLLPLPSAGWGVILIDSKIKENTGLMFEYAACVYVICQDLILTYDCLS